MGISHASKGTGGQELLNACGDLVVINLPTRPDRRVEFFEQLSRIGLSKDHPRIRVFDAIRPDKAEPFPSIGAHGCFMSHLGVLREAYNSGTDRVIICEDDLDFSRDFNSRAKHVLNLLNLQEWDLFYGFPPKGVEGLPVLGEGLLELRPEHDVLCAHFLALRRPAIEVLVPYLEAILVRPPGDPAGGPMHVDGAYNWFRRAYPQMRTIVAMPALGHQRASRTDIAELSLKDRLPIVRKMVRMARRMKNRIL